MSDGPYTAEHHEGDSYIVRGPSLPSTGAWFPKQKVAFSWRDEMNNAYAAGKAESESTLRVADAMIGAFDGDLDHVLKTLAAYHNIVVNAIMHGMPITKDVADARNAAVKILSRITT